MYYIRQLLTDDEVARVTDLRAMCEWSDGSVSYVGEPGVKKCSQIVENEITDEILRIIYSSLDRDVEFVQLTAAKETSHIIMSRYSEGMFYRPHHDSPSMGHFSTTLFLNNDYEGGELRLWNNDEVKTVKLEPGWAVTYDTGTAHEVVEVTSGDRDVAVFWTKSHIGNERDRWMYGQLAKINNLLHEKYGANGVVGSVEEAKNDPYFLSHELMYSILREHHSS